ncbi:adenylate cyclase [Leptospira perolatii]|uniref:Adenylate cyclase n=1 Tax=Leptospira perolatii TaxID=2023191 RepID=A0A2M9ZKN0_9LEPT|nr:adenylate/guanylate cyclase domain-containing protein [Leptospira perolatii]PJZ69977.1 adenylate cyclase [Leptospira perolatii]PJZ72615.1 adenylate cyclase [Leptospira perolatii]
MTADLLAPNSKWELFHPESIELQEFLEAYPWDANLLQLGEPLDYLWKFDLNANPSALWPWLIDTSSFNKRIGISEMKFSEIDGKLFGSSINAGVLMEWEEVPWEWEYCKQLNNARIYSKGFAHYVRTRYLLFDSGNDTSRLYVYFGWIPRNFVGRTVLKIGMKQLKKQYEKGLNGVVADIRKVDQKGWSGPNALSLLKEVSNKKNPIFPARIQQIRVGFIKEGQNKELVDRLLNYVLDADENDLYRIRVKTLSNAWKIPLGDLLLLFLHGCRLGLFSLSWDVICPHCRGVRTEALHLGDLPSRDSCEVCEIEFESNQIDSVEITFHVHPSIRNIQKRYFCAAEPATKAHIRLQKYLGAKQEYNSNLILPKGLYRLRMLGEKKYTLLNLQSGIEKTGFSWEPDFAAEQIDVSTNPQIRLVNSSEKPVGYIIEERKEDQESLRPSELFNFQNFRDLFSEEALSTELQLDIGVQTILFTDIVGSTRFYVQKGDTGAFSEVRQHFIEVFRIVREHNGAVVKTIGDAVMAAFSAPVEAIAASVQLQEQFSERNPNTPIRIRVSIHSGPCLAVNLNSNIDYFGNAVNFASKLQGITDSGEITFSEIVFRDREVRRLMAKEGWKVKKVLFELSWTGDHSQVYKLVTDLKGHSKQVIIS